MCIRDRYVPVLEDCELESRHLGLKMPHEVDGLEERLLRISRTLEETLEIDRMLSLAAVSYTHLDVYKRQDWRIIFE